MGGTSRSQTRSAACGLLSVVLDELVQPLVGRVDVLLTRLLHRRNFGVVADELGVLARQQQEPRVEALVLRHVAQAHHQQSF